LAKLIVMYNQPNNQEGFDEHYFHVHIPLAQKLPNLKNATVNRVLQAQNTDAKLYLIAELEFDQVVQVNEALASPEGQIVQKDLGNLLEFLDTPPVIIITE
jgi:uncharacterized protein (TIGR02118 family)